jgi:acetyl-CoA carboxylase biotin carboxyl carrier protein
MRYEEIDTLIRRFEESSLSVMEYEENAYRVRLEQKGIPGMPGGGQSMSSGCCKEDGVFSVLASGDQSTAGEPHVVSPSEQMVEEEPATVDSETEAIRAPIIGTFYSSPSPEEPPFVEDGDMVRRGDVLGIVEAMKVMNEIRAPYDCRITAVRVADGAMVEVGSALFEVEPC